MESPVIYLKNVFFCRKTRQILSGVTCFVLLLTVNVFADTAETKGLHIIKAKYGAFFGWVDVTAQLREKVVNNTISISAGNHIAGDPARLRRKHLIVEYIYDGEKNTIKVPEGAVLTIPQEFDKVEYQLVKTKAELFELVKKCPAQVGFYGINLSTGKTVEYQPDKPACLASIVKIFVLLEIMCQNDKGLVDLSKQIEYQKGDKKITSTISEALDKMIGQSDNEATNALAGLAGYDNINALPKKLGISGLSEKVLPEPGVLGGILDKRVFSKPDLSEGDLLGQHGTARAITKYFQLLYENKLISHKITQKVMEVFQRNPKNFAASGTDIDFKGLGKGGSLGWKRPPFPEYNMVGWGMLIKNETTAAAFCIWYEWFPEVMEEKQRSVWRHSISDSVVSVLLAQEKSGSAH